MNIHEEIKTEYYREFEEKLLDLMQEYASVIPAPCLSGILQCQVNLINYQTMQEQLRNITDSKEAQVVALDFATEQLVSCSNCKAESLVLKTASAHAICRNCGNVFQWREWREDEHR